MDKLLYWLRGKPTHCTYCGRELYYPSKLPIKYDRHTGKASKYVVVFGCPRFDEYEAPFHDCYSWTEKVR